MDGDPIPESDHVARYVRPSKYVNKVLDWSALLPREQDNGEASYNWLEYLGNGTVKELIALLKASLTTLTISKNGTFAALNVGRTISGMKSAQPGIQLRFIHTPLPGNDSHASLLGLDHLNEAAGTFLNDLCETYPAN
jgi:hypothetical protein